MPVAAWLVGVLGALLVLAACGGDGEATPTPEPAGPVETPTAAPGPTPTPDPVDEYVASICPDMSVGDAAHLPERPPARVFEAAADAALETYHEREMSYEGNLQRYAADGDYLNYGQVKTYTIGNQMVYDDDGVPMIRYEGVYEYNPLTIAQYALTMHGRHVRGGTEAARFIEVAEALVDLQGDDGAFRYEFDWHYYPAGEAFEAGWVSGMTQGVALSALARAHALTGDERFREAGGRALDFMLLPVEEGGTFTTLAGLSAELDGYVFFSEYPNDPEFYTLNGFIFAMLGLYDWAELMGDEEHGRLAAAYFACAMATLELIVPLFDGERFSSYDLSHVILDGQPPNLSPSYHAIHIHLLHALASITGGEVLTEYEERWRSYVDADET